MWTLPAWYRDFFAEDLRMSLIKKLCCFVTLIELSGICVAARGPMEQNPRQTAAKQGSVALFYAAHQGQLREVEFNPVIFNHVLVNQGSGYNNATGVFTAPFAGVYQFVFAAQLCRGDYNNFWYFVVNNVLTVACHAQVSGGDTVLNTCYFLGELKKGDQVWIKQSAESCAWASTTSKTITFSGVLLASEGASMLGGKYVSGHSCPPPNVIYSEVSSSAGCSFRLFSMVLTQLFGLFLSKYLL